MPALAVMGVIWGLSWLLALAAAETSSVRVAAAFLLVAAVVFALGECIHGVVQGPLAPAQVRGRYMAAWLTAAQLGFALGPAFGTLALAASPALLWLGAAATCALCGMARSRSRKDSRPCSGARHAPSPHPPWNKQG